MTETVVRLLSREDILSAEDLQQEVVEVPEWGGSLYVRGMDGTSRDAFERDMVTIKGKDVSTNWQNFRAKLVARCAVDAEGKRLFTDSDAAALGRKSAAALQRVFVVAQRLNGLSDAEVEELTADLKADQNGASGSD